MLDNKPPSGIIRVGDLVRLLQENFASGEVAVVNKNENFNGLSVYNNRKKMLVGLIDFRDSSVTVVADEEGEEGDEMGDKSKANPEGDQGRTQETAGVA